jgi:hypothetical protein
MTLYTHHTLHFTTLHTSLTAALEEKLHSSDCPGNIHSSIHGILHPLGPARPGKRLQKEKGKRPLNRQIERY